MIMCSSSSHNRLRLMRSLRPSLGATLWAAVAVQIGYPADLSCLSFLRQGARASSTRATAMLSVAGAPWRKKSGAIIASPGEKSGLYSILPLLRRVEKSAGVQR